MNHIMFCLKMILLLYVIVFGQNIPRGQTIIAGEYYFDSDPGAGNGIPITANYGTPEIAVNFSVQIQS